MENEIKDLNAPQASLSYLELASATSNRTIQVTVPASALFNLDKMQSVTKSVLGRLGCPGCHSGFDIRFQMERQFRFDEKLNFIEGIGR